MGKYANANQKINWCSLLITESRHKAKNINRDYKRHFIK